MYLRTTRRRNQDGSEVVYYALAHNVWDPETQSSKAVVVHSFGRADKVDRDQLVRLCASIGRVCGVQIVDPLDDDGEPIVPAGADPLTRAGIRQGETRALGTVWALRQMWERLGIRRALVAAGPDSSAVDRHEAALFAMVANRLCEPASKLGVWERWLDRVFLPVPMQLKLRHMYEAMDFFHDHAEQVERAVFHSVADLLNLEVDLVFFDTTTASFAIDDADPEDEDGLRLLGHSKEGTWTPQVVVALAVTRNGLPVRSWVFPGNTSDVSIVRKIRADLRDWKLTRVLFVGDAGMNSEDNRADLARACGRYVLACRTGSTKEVKANVLSRPGRYREVADNLRVKEVVVGQGERRRRYLVCHNPKQEAREAEHRRQVVAELEAELASHPKPSPQAKWAIHLRASKRYGRYLSVRKGRLVIDRATVRQAARHDGKWVLITNDDTLSVDDLARAYKGLLVIERCFRTMKRTQIQMRPMFHWLPRRIETHVKLCVLALLLERVAALSCNRSWSWIRRDLDRLQATWFATDSHQFFRVNDPPAATRELLRRLEVDPPKRVLDIRPLEAVPEPA